MYDDLVRNERGISEILGTVLLISMVLLGSATVIIFGASAISDATQRTTTEAATDYLETVDSRLATLAASSDDPEVAFDPQDAAAKDYSVERDGYLNVTINDDNDCSFEQDFSTITYEDSNGNTVGYEAGGVWRAGINGSTSVTPPDVALSDGMLSIHLINVTGNFDQARTTIAQNATATRNSTDVASTALLSDGCQRPDNVTLEVKSQFYEGWANYLESDTGKSVSVDRGAETVSLTLTEGDLHLSVRDSENEVIDLGGADYMEDVILDDSVSPPRIGVDKGDAGPYMAYTGPVTNDTLDYGRQISVEGTNVTGPPLDVSFVLDESGSMWSQADPSCNPYRPDYEDCPSKLEAAQDAARDFVGTIDESKDRIGLIGYNHEPDYELVSGKWYFSNDQSKVNDTINTTNSGGNTRIDLGLADSNTMFDMKSNETKRKISILLTDGENVCDNRGCDADSKTVEQAKYADDQGITVFTVGFGPDYNLDESLLESVADETGGDYYHAEDAEELREAFEDISTRIKAEDAVAKVPMTTNVSNPTGTIVSQPEIPGDADHVANTSNGLLNVNDPTAPSMFSHSFSIDDGEYFELNVTEYNCAEDSYNVTSETVTVGGETRSVARCTDIESRNESHDGQIYVDGDQATLLEQTTYADWQSNITRALNSDRYPDTRIESDGTLNTSSNQALVVYDLPPEGGGTRNTLALMVRIGLADDSEGPGVVDVRISEAETT